MLRSTTKPRATTQQGVCNMKQPKIGENQTAVVGADRTRSVQIQARSEDLRGVETSLV
jgi:hypothetical protein